MLLRSGHPDVEGLCLALADWSAELRILAGRKQETPPGLNPAAEEKPVPLDYALIE